MSTSSHSTTATTTTTKFSRCQYFVSPPQEPGDPNVHAARMGDAHYCCCSITATTTTTLFSRYWCFISPALQEPGDPYVHAAHSGDLPTLELLRRLGCPLPPPGSTEPFTRAVYGSSRGIMDTKPGQASEPALEWLLDAGFPVDWGEALEAAAERDDEQDATRVCAWLAAQQEEREGRGEWKERRAERGREREEAGGEGEEREGEGLRRVRARR